ncbi:MAG: sigma 54-interacting transcriptional regulator [Deltaproteobacteria bacterium]|nr:sigma 54-interacting transcriptional regulator [Deltaproteobacteria bacterium]
MSASTTETRRAAFGAVSAAFASLGRVCMALDAGLRVRHASQAVEGLLGAGAAARLVGRPVEELLGEELFGEGAPLRQALQAGERREGWRASLRGDGPGARLVSVTVAPLHHDPESACDPEAAYLVVMRPDEEDHLRATGPAGFAGLVAHSPAMVRVLRLVDQLRHRETTVLLQGESGTGKELVARAIHAHSPRRSGPFVAVSCAALPADLLESELFGHVRGAFTGAVRDRAGRFEVAQGGTLFLDEVGDLPLPLQVKLLRVLQERSYERVGDSTTLRADARIVAATHRDLRRAVEAGAFRDDLYYRLRVFPIELPPLRERREDIEPIARYLLLRVGERGGRALRFSPDALRALLSYPWPGNVRELENALEFAVTVSQGQTVRAEDLPPEVSGARLAAPEASPPGPPARAAVADHEGQRTALVAALDRSRWKVAEAARALGISRSTLWRRMRELGVSR